MNTKDKTELGNLIATISVHNTKATRVQSLKNGIEDFIDKRYTLKNLPSSQVIIHSQPQHGFYYWVKHYDDSKYEVAHAVLYMKEIHFEFMMDSENFPFPKDVSDWKRQPIQPFNEADYG